MKMEIKRDGIKITSESEMEYAFIKDTLGLSVDGSYVKLKLHKSLTDENYFWLETDRNVN